ncbi:unnamed protein product, partial [Protopolystoma xenopodis]
MPKCMSVKHAHWASLLRPMKATFVPHRWGVAELNCRECLGYFVFVVAPFTMVSSLVNKDNQSDSTFLVVMTSLWFSILDAADQKMPDTLQLISSQSAAYSAGLFASP